MKNLSLAVRIFGALCESTLPAGTHTTWDWDATKAAILGAPGRESLVEEVELLNDARRERVLRYAGSFEPLKPLGEAYVFGDDNTARKFAEDVQGIGGFTTRLCGNVVAANGDDTRAIEELAMGRGGSIFDGPSLVDAFESVDADLPYAMILGGIPISLMESSITGILRGNLDESTFAQTRLYRARIKNFAQQRPTVYGVDQRLVEGCIKAGMVGEHLHSHLSESFPRLRSFLMEQDPVGAGQPADGQVAQSDPTDDQRGGVSQGNPDAEAGQPATSKEEPQDNTDTPTEPGRDETEAGQVKLSDGTMVAEPVLKQAMAKMLQNLATQLENGTTGGQPEERQGDEQPEDEQPEEEKPDAAEEEKPDEPTATTQSVAAEQPAPAPGPPTTPPQQESSLREKKMSDKARDFVAKDIRKQMKGGKTHKQSVGAALGAAKAKGLKIPPKKDEARIQEKTFKTKGYGSIKLPEGVGVKWSAVNQAWLVTRKNSVMLVAHTERDLVTYINELNQGHTGGMGRVSGAQKKVPGYAKGKTVGESRVSQAAARVESLTKADRDQAKKIGVVSKGPAKQGIKKPWRKSAASNPDGGDAVQEARSGERDDAADAAWFVKVRSQLARLLGRRSNVSVDNGPTPDYFNAKHLTLKIRVKFKGPSGGGMSARIYKELGSDKLVVRTEDDYDDSSVGNIDYGGGKTVREVAAFIIDQADHLRESKMREGRTPRETLDELALLAPQRAELMDLLVTHHGGRNISGAVHRQLSGMGDDALLRLAQKLGLTEATMVSEQALPTNGVSAFVETRGPWKRRSSQRSFDGWWEAPAKHGSGDKWWVDPTDVVAVHYDDSTYGEWSSSVRVLKGSEAAARRILAGQPGENFETPRVVGESVHEGNASAAHAKTVRSKSGGYKSNTRDVGRQKRGGRKKLKRAGNKAARRQGKKEAGVDEARTPREILDILRAVRDIAPGRRTSDAVRAFEAFVRNGDTKRLHEVNRAMQSAMHDLRRKHVGSELLGMIETVREDISDMLGESFDRDAHLFEQLDVGQDGEADAAGKGFADAAMTLKRCRQEAFDLTTNQLVRLESLATATGAKKTAKLVAKARELATSYLDDLKQMADLLNKANDQFKSEGGKGGETAAPDEMAVNGDGEAAAPAAPVPADPNMQTSATPEAPAPVVATESRVRAAVARLVSTSVPERIAEGESLRDMRVAIARHCPDLALTTNMVTEVFHRLRRARNLSEARMFRVTLDEGDRQLLESVDSPLAARAQRNRSVTVTEHELNSACHSLRGTGSQDHGLLAEALEKMAQRAVVGAS